MNPFRDTIVASPWNATPADISEIHNAVYDECLNGLEQVRASGRSGALLIHGEAGSGKTHLLSRLRTTLTPRAPIATDRPESLFVWGRLQTSPRMIWRSLRRTIVEDWFRPVEQGLPQIDRILFHRLAAIRPAEWDLEPWYEYMLEEDPAGLQELLEQIAQTLHLDHNLAVAFHHIAFRRFRRELRAWLSGTSLPESVLDRMELAREDGTEEELEEHAKQIVLMLCQLTGPSLPILLSFDQVEALQSRPGDEEALFVFGQTVSTLHDSTSNVLLVSCVQSAFATELKNRVRGADYDRLASRGAFSLSPLNRHQALRLIAARLEAAAFDSASRPQSERADDFGCWPLEAREFESLFQDGAVSPRKLLNLCAHRFEQFEHPSSTPAPTPAEKEATLAIFLHDQLVNSAAEKAVENTPDRTEEILQHGLPLVLEVMVPGAKMVDDKLLPDVPLIFATTQGKLGISICTQSNMNSLASRLRRLNSQILLQHLTRLVLIRDERVPLSEGAKKARQYLAELEQQQAVTVFPSVEALATLDALRNLLSDAKSGDLACEGESIPPAAVEVWLQSHFPHPLRVLADELFAELAVSTVIGTGLSNESKVGQAPPPDDESHPEPSSGSA